MGPQVVLAAIASPSRDLAQLPEGLSHNRGQNPDLGADGRPVRHGPHEPQDDPVVGAAVIPIQRAGFGRARAPHVIKTVGNKEAQVTVVVVISPGAATGACDILDHHAFGHSRERPVAIIVKEKIDPSLAQVEVIVRNENIKIAVVIVVAPGAAPGAAVLETARRHDFESLCAVVAVESIRVP